MPLASLSLRLLLPTWHLLPMEARSAVNILTSSFELYIPGLADNARITRVSNTARRPPIHGLLIGGFELPRMGGLRLQENT